MLKIRNNQLKISSIILKLQKLRFKCFKFIGGVQSNDDK